MSSEILPLSEKILSSFRRLGRIIRSRQTAVQRLRFVRTFGRKSGVEIYFSEISSRRSMGFVDGRPITMPSTPPTICACLRRTYMTNACQQRFSLRSAL